MTLREKLHAALLEGPVTLRDLSQIVGLKEREIIDHLEHVRRSARRSGERFVIEPAACVACGMSFEDRRRFTKPSRCPRCKSERIRAPRFHLVPEGSSAKR